MRVHCILYIYIKTCAACSRKSWKVWLLERVRWAIRYKPSEMYLKKKAAATTTTICMSQTEEESIWENKINKKVKESQKYALQFSIKTGSENGPSTKWTTREKKTVNWFESRFLGIHIFRVSVCLRVECTDRIGIRSKAVRQASKERKKCKMTEVDRLPSQKCNANARYSGYEMIQSVCIRKW